jgi:SAM-dependent methyltransferase
VGLYCAGLFICCMVCHGEVYRIRPDPRHLTGFYLMIAAGGALGGILVAVVAPLVFTDYFELQWGLVLCCLALTLVCAADRDPAKFNEWRWLSCALTVVAWIAVDGSLVWLGHRYPSLPKQSIWGLRAAWWGFLLLVVGYWITTGRFKTFKFWRLLTCLWLGLALPILVAALWAQAQGANSDAVNTSRNFYGVLKVFEQRKVSAKEHHYLLVHGRITHGLQFLDPERSGWATSYYGEDSGISMAINALPAGPRKIGVIGLGTGTMAVFARAGDTMRIYEINPDVRRLATSRFSYVTKSHGNVEVVLGDARLSMEAEPPQNYDLLALDAFSSDAIPVHLLTRESFALYERHLKTNGIIVLHISNRYLNLEPVVVNLAHEFGYHIAIIDDDNEDGDWWTFPSTWVVLSKNRSVVESDPIAKVASTIRPPKHPVPLWTDDFASLFQILK